MVSSHADATRQLLLSSRFTDGTEGRWPAHRPGTSRAGGSIQGERVSGWDTSWLEAQTRRAALTHVGGRKVDQIPLRPPAPPAVNGHTGSAGKPQHQGHHGALPRLFYFSTEVTSVSQADPHPTPGPAPPAEGLWPGENFLLRLWPGRRSPGRTLPLEAWMSSPICSVHRNATQEPPTCPWSLGLNLPLYVWRQPQHPRPPPGDPAASTELGRGTRRRSIPACPAAATRENLHLGAPRTTLLSSGNWPSVGTYRAPADVSNTPSEPPL